jgi:hypothetical protein
MMSRDLAMETAAPLRIGKNILLVGEKDVLLRKTNRSKITLAFWTSLQVLIISTAIFLIYKRNQPLHWPLAAEGRFLLGAMLIGILFFIAWTLRSAINEWKDYKISREHGEISVNGRRFADQSQTEIVIKEKVGRDGIGVAYEIQLKNNTRKLILSFGNRLSEAKEVSSVIGNCFGLQVRERLRS